MFLQHVQSAWDLWRLFCLVNTFPRFIYGKTVIRMLNILWVLGDGLDLWWSSRGKFHRRGFQHAPEMRNSHLNFSRKPTRKRPLERIRRCSRQTQPSFRFHYRRHHSPFWISCFQSCHCQNFQFSCITRTGRSKSRCLSCWEYIYSSISTLRNVAYLPRTKYVKLNPSLPSPKPNLLSSLRYERYRRTDIHKTL
jgi:hypothetical protein